MATVKLDPSNGSIRLGEMARGSCCSSADYVTGTVLESAGSNLSAAALPAHSALLREQVSPTSPKAPSMRCSSGSSKRGLVDVEKVSGKRPPRKMYSLDAQGQQYLEESCSTWSFLTQRRQFRADRRLRPARGHRPQLRPPGLRAHRGRRHLSTPAPEHP